MPKADERFRSVHTQVEIIKREKGVVTFGAGDEKFLPLTLVVNAMPLPNRIAFLQNIVTGWLEARSKGFFSRELFDLLGHLIGGSTKIEKQGLSFATQYRPDGPELVLLLTHYDVGEEKCVGNEIFHVKGPVTLTEKYMSALVTDDWVIAKGYSPHRHGTAFVLKTDVS
jgi:hypothetical protein